MKTRMVEEYFAKYIEVDNVLFCKRWNVDADLNEQELTDFVIKVLDDFNPYLGQESNIYISKTKEWVKRDNFSTLDELSGYLNDWMEACTKFGPIKKV